MYIYLIYTARERATENTVTERERERQDDIVFLQSSMYVHVQLQERELG